MIPSQILLLQWIGMGLMVETEAKHLMEAGKTVVDYFHENGFACQILKGNSVGRYYPNPDRRFSGEAVFVNGA